MKRYSYPPVLLATGILLIGVTTGCSGDSSADGGTVVTVTREAAGSGACSYDAQPAATAFTDRAEIGIMTPDGEGDDRYLLGTVDTSTYSCEGLSWVSDDSGWVKNAASGSGAGRTVVFFIDGVQVPQPVTVSRISGITRIDDDTVDVTYTVKDSHADQGTGATVRYTVSDGSLTTDGDGAPDSAVLWKTDLPYTSGSGTGAGAPQPTSEHDPGAGEDGAGDDSDSTDIMSSAPTAGSVGADGMVSMETPDGTGIRCVLTSSPFCVSKAPYWTVDGQPANYVQLETGTANQSDFGTGWSSDATPVPAGQRVTVTGTSGDAYIAWDGTDVIYNATGGDQAVVLSPDGLTTVSD